MKAKFRFEDAVLWQDEDFILVNKPPFLSTLEDRQGGPQLLGMARQHEPAAQVCHRLDKDTSGVLAIARNPEAYRHLNMQFEKREVVKVYHAVADGLHDFREELINAPILKMDEGYVRISREGKPAQTWVRTLMPYRQHSLIECRPVTGRMHQIRIHLSSRGASITGDTRYGGKPLMLSALKRRFKLKKGDEEEPFMKRMALHAWSLEFIDLRGERRTVVAPYPKDFHAMLRQLELNS